MDDTIHYDSPIVPAPDRMSFSRSAVALVSAAACTLGEARPAPAHGGALYRGFGPAERGQPSVEDVSLVRLIAAPERYEGRRVRVKGYVRLEFEGNAVYLHREDRVHGLTANGLWLESPAGRPPRVTDGYAIVEGTFTARDRGHLGLWSGAIQRTTRLDPSN